MKRQSIYFSGEAWIKSIFLFFVFENKSITSSINVGSVDNSFNICFSMASDDKFDNRLCNKPYAIFIVIGSQSSSSVTQVIAFFNSIKWVKNYLRYDHEKLFLAFPKNKQHPNDVLPTVHVQSDLPQIRIRKEYYYIISLSYRHVVIIYELKQTTLLNFIHHILHLTKYCLTTVSRLNFKKLCVISETYDEKKKSFKFNTRDLALQQIYSHYFRLKITFLMLKIHGFNTFHSNNGSLNKCLKKNNNVDRDMSRIFYEHFEIAPNLHLSSFYLSGVAYTKYTGITQLGDREYSITTHSSLDRAIGRNVLIKRLKTYLRNTMGELTQWFGHYGCSSWNYQYNLQ
ncbi:hypothetical protein AGLY_016511 [Aphis glycines]|uniref:Uncharacterized protein n=1 Tax=Aphis glycines TaxID=307491 RepID=A0A6G0SZI2_APHGL|nr:hypothetical protein AGLY_016511 [Aphis glycines]